MSSDAAKAKPGPKAAVFTRECFEGLCEIQCTILEVCRVFRCDDKTLVAWIRREYKPEGINQFSEAFKRFSVGGHASLRRKQFNLALKGQGHAAMLIWLGKQYLGQRDMPVEFDKTAIPAPVYTMVRTKAKEAV